MGHIPNIDAIPGALFTLRIQYEYTDDGARVSGPEMVSILETVYGDYHITNKYEISNMTLIKNTV